MQRKNTTYNSSSAAIKIALIGEGAEIGDGVKLENCHVSAVVDGTSTVTDQNPTSDSAIASEVITSLQKNKTSISASLIGPGAKVGSGAVISGCSVSGVSIESVRSNRR